MKLESKAKNYAEALLNVAAHQSGAEKAVRDSLALVNSALKVSPEFRAFLLSKRISEVQKAMAVKSALGDQCHEIVSEFLGLVCGDNLVKLLALIQTAYNAQFAEAMNEFVGVMTFDSSPISNAINEICNALFPELTDTANFVPVYCANSSSNFETLSPPTNDSFLNA